MSTEPRSLIAPRKPPSPIKVDAATKERVRLAAAFLGIEQGEFVRRLVAEYVEANARAALLDGDEAVLTYLRDGARDG